MGLWWMLFSSIRSVLPSLLEEYLTLASTISSRIATPGLVVQYLGNLFYLFTFSKMKITF